MQDLQRQMPAIFSVYDKDPPANGITEQTGLIGDVWETEFQHDFSLKQSKSVNDLSRRSLGLKQ